MPRLRPKVHQVKLERAVQHTNWRRMAYCGHQHVLSEYSILNGAQLIVGTLVACQSCGAYLCHRSKYLRKDCSGPNPQSAALKNQLRRIQRHQHPLAEQRYKEYTLQVTRGVTREELMHEEASEEQLHQVQL
eukprot:797522-Amphidinium_carterae.1